MTKVNLTISKDYFIAKKVDRDLSHPFLKDFFIVCDVGGGTGFDTFLIMNCVCFAIDLDTSLNALKIAKMRVDDIEISNNLGFICASATDLPFRSKILDMITSFSVLDHIPGKENAQRAISEFSDVVRHGGFVTITVPNSLFLIGSLIMKIKKYTDKDTYFEQRFSPKELQKMIKSEGLTPILFDSHYPTVVGYTLLKWNFPKIIQKVPTRLLYPTLRLAEKIFGIIQHVPWLKLFGSRMGYLSKPRRHARAN